MRSITLFLLATTFACDGGGGDDTGTDDTAGDDTASDDTADDTADTDTGTDTDTGVDFGVGADFVSDGPGAGDLWILDLPSTSAEIPNNACGIESQNSLFFPGNDATFEITLLDAQDHTFDIQLQGASWGPVVPCDYTTDGAFTCDDAGMSTNLNSLSPPYNMDAVVSDTLHLEGQFRTRVADDPETDLDHTYGARWSADIELTYSRSCTGTQCANAATGSGASGFPCTSVLPTETVNYADPTLP